MERSRSRNMFDIMRRRSRRRDEDVNIQSQEKAPEENINPLEENSNMQPRLALGLSSSWKWNNSPKVYYQSGDDEEIIKDFDEDARVSILMSIKVAKDNRHEFVKTEHLMRALLAANAGRRQGPRQARRIFTQAGMNPDMFLQFTDKFIEEHPEMIDQSTGPMQGHGPDTEKFMKRARKWKRKLDDKLISTEHLALSFLKDQRFGNVLYKRFGLTKKALEDAIRATSDIKTNVPHSEFKSKQLERNATSLTKLAQDGKLNPVFARDDEIDECITILLSKSKGNPVLIGESGVGKTAIVEGIAQKIVEGDVPDNLKNCTIMSLNTGSLVADTTYRGELEKKLEDIFKEVVASNRRVILFVDEMHTLMGAGSIDGNPLDIANMLKPLLARGEFRMIGATTLNEYQMHVEKDAALARRFTQVYIETPSTEKVAVILNGIRPLYESYHGVRISDSALDESIKLSERYIIGPHQPDKAIDVLEAAARLVSVEMNSKPPKLKEMYDQISRLEIEKYSNIDTPMFEQFNEEISKLEELVSPIEERWESEKTWIKAVQLLKQKANESILEFKNLVKTHDAVAAANFKKDVLTRNIEAFETGEKDLDMYQEAENCLLHDKVTSQHIKRIISQKTGIPLSSGQQSEREKLSQLPVELQRRVTGQDRAVKAVAISIQRWKMGFSDPRRPIANLLFLGPTGVGKTELAKSIAENLFGNEDAMVRIDMGEYMQLDSVSKLLGTYGEPGRLTEPVRMRGYSVVLLDEIEKAHPDIMNILLRVMGEGLLTDSRNRVVNFRNAIILMTSNIGAEVIIANMEEPYERIKEMVVDEARKSFRAEFISRLDEMVVFRPLGMVDVTSITHMQLTRLKKLVEPRRMTLCFSDEAIQVLSELAYDVQYGARAVERVVREHVANELTLGYLEGKYGDRDTIHVRVRTADDPGSSEAPLQPLVFTRGGDSVSGT